MLNKQGPAFERNRLNGQIFREISVSGEWCNKKEHEPKEIHGHCAIFLVVVSCVHVNFAGRHRFAIIWIGQHFNNTMKTTVSLFTFPFQRQFCGSVYCRVIRLHTWMDGILAAQHTDTQTTSNQYDSTNVQSNGRVPGVDSIEIGQNKEYYCMSSTCKENSGAPHSSSFVLWRINLINFHRFYSRLIRGKMSADKGKMMAWMPRQQWNSDRRRKRAKENGDGQYRKGKEENKSFGTDNGWHWTTAWRTRLDE